MKGPPRLREDPGLRDVFDAERDALGPFDTSALRQRVLDGEPLPPPPRRWPGRSLGVGVGVGLLVVAAVSLRSAAPPDPIAPLRAPAPITALAPRATVSVSRAITSAPSPEAEPEAPPPVAPTPAAGTLASAAAAVPPPAASAVAEPPATSDPQLVPPSPPPADPAAPAAAPTEADVGELQRELTAYNAALDAAARLAWGEARDRYEAYLGRWPAGRLRAEAQLGLLEAYVASAQPERAEPLARQLLGDPHHAARADEVRLLRAEALVQLARCDEALDALRDLPRSARLTRVRAACRRR